MGAAVPFIAIGATLLSTAVSAIGMANQAAAQKAQADYQSQIARNNATIMQRNADLARQQGEVNAQNQGLKTSQITGAQKAALAAQGGDINTGSPASIIGDTAMAGKSDTDTIRYNASLKAYGFESEAAGATGTANLYSMAGANATSNLPFAMGSTLLGGASKAGGMWYDYMKNGSIMNSPTTGPGTGYTY